MTFGHPAVFNQNYNFQLFFVVLFSLFITACISIPSAEQRWESAQQLAREAGWDAQIIAAAPFKIAAFFPEKQRAFNGILTVYIEGDGLAWLTSSIISPDPTPVKPVSLMLALQDDQNAAVAYLGRPCQYTLKQDQHCSKKYWTNHRFSLAVVQAMNTAIDKLKLKMNAQKIQLVGYSGGGTIAALISARRDDVRLLITIAGNLDHQAWTEYHNLSALSGSLNPAEEWQKLENLQQIHFAGASDKIIPKAIISSYISQFNNTNLIFKTIPKFDHYCCWIEKWPELLKASMFSLRANKLKNLREPQNN